MKRTNKWQFWFRANTRDYLRNPGLGWRVFDAGIIKIEDFPDHGARIQPQHYKGFIIRFSWWFPIDRAL